MIAFGSLSGARSGLNPSYLKRRRRDMLQARKEKQALVDSHGRFVWYELITTDVKLAKAFYASVMGWGTRRASMPGSTYSLFTVGDSPVAALVSMPEDGRRTGATSRWIGYVGVDDVDAAVERIKQLGGAVYVPPMDVPNISRFSVVADPQMATLALVKGLKSGQAPVRRARRAGARGLARVACRRLGDGVRFLRRAIWLAKSRQPCRRDGHVSGVLRRRGDDRRHVHQACRHCRCPSGFTISTSTTSRRRQSAWKPAAAKSCMARLKCRAAPGSSIAWTLRAPYSRCSTGAAAKLLGMFISTASRRAIHRSAERPSDLDVLGNRKLVGMGLRRLSPFHRHLDGGRAITLGRASAGSFRFRPAADRKLTYRSLDVEFDPRHLCEQIDIRDPDRTSAEPHVARHQVERLR